MTPLPDAQLAVDVKRCSCKKAKCLKLYCSCFVSGAFCSGCSCVECQNTVDNHAAVMMERQRIVDRSPRRAFVPKSDQQQAGGPAVHGEGCKCRRSRCLKKYCVCFEGRMHCSSMCRYDACAAGSSNCVAIPGFDLNGI